MKNKNLSYFADGIMSGVFLCIGCAVNLSVDSPLAGAFLFSLGLFAIITFRLGLYTGKAGYMAMRPPSYIIEVILTLIGNITGTAFGGWLLNLTRFGEEAYASRAQIIIQTKVSDSPASIAVLAIFCGILMFTAVEGNRRTSQNGNYIGSLFIVVLPVMVFILCGFNHSIADFSYFFISRCAEAASFLPYIILVILGNAVGCMLIPFFKRFSANKL